MKELKIAARLRPFSFEPGIIVPLPGSSVALQLYPKLMRIIPLDAGAATDYPILLVGGIENFMVTLDLERGRIDVRGKDEKGAFTYTVSASEGVISKRKLFDKEPQLKALHTIQSKERLSFGEHKALDWTHVLRRADLKEILPVWHRLALWTDKVDQPKGGATQLLGDFDDRRTICKNYLEFFRSAFTGLMTPQLDDAHHLGYFEGKATGSPLGMIHLITYFRACLFREEEGVLYILPKLPPELPVGRFLNIETEEGHLLSFEWTKKQLRRLIIKCASSGEVRFMLQRGIKSFRVRGKRASVEEPITIKKGEILYIDQIQK